jgi:hypothetical protein
MPMPAALADAGMAVICAASRYPKDDRTLMMEKLLIEVALGSPYGRGARGVRDVARRLETGRGALQLEEMRRDRDACRDEARRLALAE